MHAAIIGLVMRPPAGCPSAPGVLFRASLALDAPLKV